MIGVRMKEERKRLGLSQEECAAISGASRRAYIDWEGGKTSPTAVQLAALAAAGVDILYVLTGQRGGVVLTPREQAMLGKYRGLPGSAQDAAQTLLGALAQPPGLKKDQAA